MNSRKAKKQASSQADVGDIEAFVRILQDIGAPRGLASQLLEACNLSADVSTDEGAASALNKLFDNGLKPGDDYSGFFSGLRPVHLFESDSDPEVLAADQEVEFEVALDSGCVEHV